MTTDLSWLMTRFRDDNSGVHHVLLLSGDGLRLAHDDLLDIDAADHLSAVAIGMARMAEAADQHFGGEGSMRSVSVDLPQRQMLIMSAGHGSVLCVLAAPDADLATLGFHMVQLIGSVQSHLDVPARTTEART